MNGVAPCWMALGMSVELMTKYDTEELQLFILEGIPAMFCSIYTFFYLPNYPQTVEFLSEDEREAVIADLPKQAPTMGAKTFDFEQIKSLFKNPTFVPLWYWRLGHLVRVADRHLRARHLKHRDLAGHDYGGSLISTKY
jgi:hypothetical protein